MASILGAGVLRTLLTPQFRNPPMNIPFVPVSVRRSSKLRRASGKAAVEFDAASDASDAVGRLHVKIHVRNGEIRSIAVRTRMSNFIVNALNVLPNILQTEKDSVA